MRPAFEFKTRPFDHQLAEWEAARGAGARALFWEQGTGKTKELLDQAAWLYCQGEIDGVLVVAPNGVHRNWITDELPAHLPDAVAEQTRAHHYTSAKAGTKRHRMLCGQVLEHPGLAVMAMSYEGFMTPHGKEYAKKFLTGREVFYVLDESRRIKTPGIKRTKTIVASGKYGKYRRIATGTPVANGPFDIYAPIRFLDPDFWRPYGMSTFGAFKTYFGVWEQIRTGSGQRFEKLVMLRCLDHLARMLEPISSRVTKDEVLDLPLKLYGQRYFEMTREQAALYRQVREDFIAMLESGETITAPLAITRQLRLRQVLSGYVPTDDGELHEIEGSNPRLRALEELADDTPHQAIIWAHFRRDVDQICTLLGDQCVRYDGATKEGDRAAAIRRFQAGEVKFFVGNPAACGTGLTLHAARTVIYYANDFDLEKRQQSEDRAHRIGQEHPVNYIDLICEGTVDEWIAKAQQRKEEISATILGDALRAEK